MKRNESVYILPDDTVFNAPLGNSLRLLHSLVPIILSVTPDCIAQIFISSSSNSLLAPLLMGRDAVQLLKPLGRAHSSC